MRTRSRGFLCAAKRAAVAARGRSSLAKNTQKQKGNFISPPTTHTSPPVDAKHAHPVHGRQLGNHEGDQHGQVEAQGLGRKVGAVRRGGKGEGGEDGEKLAGGGVVDAVVQL